MEIIEKIDEGVKKEIEKLVAEVAEKIIKICPPSMCGQCITDIVTVVETDLQKLLEAEQASLTSVQTALAAIPKLVSKQA